MRIGLLALLFAVPLAGQVSQKAQQIHDRALVFDAHIHAVDREFYNGGDIGVRKPDGQFDLPRAREGGLGAMFFSLYVPEAYYPARLETKQALRMIDFGLSQLKKNRDRIELALTATDVDRIHREGKIHAVLDREGSYDLEGDLE